MKCCGLMGHMWRCSQTKLTKKESKGWLLRKRVTTSKIMRQGSAGESYRPFADILSELKESDAAVLGASALGWEAKYRAEVPALEKAATEIRPEE